MPGSSPMNDYLAGAIGGCAGVAVGHPLDTVKVQMQTQGGDNAYRGLVDCIRHISHNNWKNGFFRGMSWPLVSFGLMNSVFFGTYGHMLQTIGHDIHDTTQTHLLQIFGVGLLATAPTVFFACPIDVVKVTLQSQIKHDVCPTTGMAKAFYHGPIEATKMIVKMRGFRGMYRGFWTQLVRDSPANGVYMAFYELSTYKASKCIPSVHPFFVNFVTGGLAGVLSWMIIIPVDVVKSRMQAYQSNYTSGFWQCARKAYREDGWNVFYRGSVAVALRAFPVNAITLSVYTEVLHVLK